MALSKAANRCRKGSRWMYPLAFSSASGSSSTIIQLIFMGINKQIYAISRLFSDNIQCVAIGVQ